jgi:hypothetical protein
MLIVSDFRPARGRNGKARCVGSRGRLRERQQRTCDRTGTWDWRNGPSTALLPHDQPESWFSALNTGNSKTLRGWRLA